MLFVVYIFDVFARLGVASDLIVWPIWNPGTYAKRDCKVHVGTWLTDIRAGF